MRKIIFTIILILVVSTAFIPIDNVHAQLAFGGFNVFTVYCTCSGNWVVYLTPPKGGFFSYRFTPQFLNYRLPFAGSWALGNYVPGDICTFSVVFGCITFVQPQGLITPYVGTSL